MLRFEIDSLLERVAPLTFGIGATIGEPPRMQVMAAGSGVFVAPFLAITARHVSRALFDLEGGDPGLTNADAIRNSLHAPFMFQILQPARQPSPNALWHVDHSRDFLHTDLCLMQVSAENGDALAIQYTWPTRFLDLELIPPGVGEAVQAFGYPCHAVRTDGTQLFIDAPATFSEGTVRAVHSPFRDRVMLNFPVFEVEMWADKGFSGGPVFHQGKLCGLVVAGLDSDEPGEHVTYVASLWPLLRANVDFGLGKSFLIQDLLRRGVLSASGWSDLAARVVVTVDETGREYVDLSVDPPA